MKRVLPARRLVSAAPANGGYVTPSTPISIESVIRTSEAVIPYDKAPQPSPYKQPDGRIQIGPTDV